MLQQSSLYAYFPARDLNRARRFYEETLGLEPKLANDGGVTYEFANGTAPLNQVAFAPPAMHQAWRVWYY